MACMGGGVIGVVVRYVREVQRDERCDGGDVGGREGHVDGGVW